MRLLGPLVAIVAVLAALGSCATSTAGQAVAGSGADSTSRSGGDPGTRATSGSQTSASPLADIDPCTLLTTAAMAKLGITSEGRPDKIVEARGCRWTVRGPSDTYVYGVGLLDNSGISKIPSNIAVEPISDIGRHKAVRVKRPGGTVGCAIVLGVTETSRADIQVVAGTDTAKACELVMELATLVEPELP